MKVRTLTLNPFAILFYTVAIGMAATGNVSWAIVILLFLSQVKLDITFTL